MSNFESRNAYTDGYVFASGCGLHINPNNLVPAASTSRNAPAPYPMYHGLVPPQPTGPRRCNSSAQSVAQSQSAQSVRSVQAQCSQAQCAHASSASSTASCPLGTSLINRSSTAPTASLLVDRRVEHLEENMKRVRDELDSLIASIKEGKHGTELDASVGSWMHATTIHATTEYVTLDDSIASVVAQVKPTLVQEGTMLSVSYPMHKVAVGDRVVIVMRRRMVDPETAQISGSWVIVNVPGAEPSTLVSNFAF